MRWRVVAALVWLACPGSSAPVFAAAPAAVFPFEFVDTSGEPPTPGREARLRLATRALEESLAKAGLYSAIDLTPLSSKVEATSPRYACRECFLSLAREAGAPIASRRSRTSSRR